MQLKVDVFLERLYIMYLLKRDEHIKFNFSVIPGVVVTVVYETVPFEAHLAWLFVFIVFFRDFPQFI